MLRDRHVVGPGRVADGDVPGDGGGYVDHVEARSELGDAAEVGQGVEQSGVEMEIVPGNHDVRALEAAGLRSAVIEAVLASYEKNFDLK